MAPAIDHTFTNGCHVHSNGAYHDRPGCDYSDRADETADLLKATQDLLIPFIADADKKRVQHPPQEFSRDASEKIETGWSDWRNRDILAKKTSNKIHEVTPDSTNQNSTINPLEPKELTKRLGFVFPDEGQGKDGLIEMLEKILRYSVNTWDQGFLHKLYATTNPIGVVSELILAVLNTNLHVYKVSPALSVIERLTSQKLAKLFGLTGPHAGGGTHPGGSASNLAALVIARNTAFPAIRHKGNNGRNLVVFTSKDSHYSITKAAQTCGIGANNVWKVPVDSSGRMRVDKLTSLLREARLQGLEPFFINATAGTTVLGACDPLNEIADLCDKQGLWLHVDGSWGGAAIFSDKHKHSLRGIERARSITTNPHKMLGVPVTCSFLLASDMRVFWRANRFEAGYLFHQTSPNPDSTNNDDGEKEEEEEEVSWDLADSTLQCGRKGDSLKLALSWLYQGRAGLAHYVESGFDNATYLASLVRSHPDLILVSTFPPPCLQVCFYHRPSNKKKGGGKGGLDEIWEDESEEEEEEGEEEVSRHTREVCERLAERRFMIDYAPGPRGDFVRVVVNGGTRRETLDGIVEGVVDVGGGGN